MGEHIVTREDCAQPREGPRCPESGASVPPSDCGHLDNSAAPESRQATSPLAYVPYVADFGSVAIHEHLLRVTASASRRLVCARTLPRRGQVFSFSYRSRYRLLCRLASVRADQVSTPVFITLTYHDVYPSEPEHVTDHVEAWLKALERRYSVVHYIRRVELQRRGAPHHHVILWLRAGDERLSERSEQIAIRTEWTRIVAPGDRHHFRHGTRIDILKSYRQASGYVAKYAAKLERPGDVEYRGRRWASDRSLPIDPITVDPLRFGEVVCLKRLVRRMLRARFRRGRMPRPFTTSKVGFSTFIEPAVSCILISAAIEVAGGKYADVAVEHCLPSR